MSNFIDRFMGRKPSPAQSAKDRLKLVLVTDRTTISPEDLRKMQTEILQIIQKYCRVREEDVNMKFEQRERENYLVADIPLTSIRPDEKPGAVRLETTLVTNEFAENSNNEAGILSLDQDSPKENVVVQSSETSKSSDSETVSTGSAEDKNQQDTPGDRVQVKGAPSGISAGSDASTGSQSESDSSPDTVSSDDE